MTKSLKVNLEDVPISDKVKSEMSLTVADQQFIKRCFDRQDSAIEKYIDEIYDTHATLIIDSVRDMLDEYKGEIFVRLDNIEKSIGNINKDIIEIHRQLAVHDKCIEKIKSHLKLDV